MINMLMSNKLETVQFWKIRNSNNKQFKLINTNISELKLININE